MEFEDWQPLSYEEGLREIDDFYGPSPTSSPKLETLARCDVHQENPPSELLAKDVSDLGESHDDTELLMPPAAEWGLDGVADDDEFANLLTDIEHFSEPIAPDGELPMNPALPQYGPASASPALPQAFTPGTNESDGAADRSHASTEPPSSSNKSLLHDEMRSEENYDDSFDDEALPPPSFSRAVGSEEKSAEEAGTTASIKIPKRTRENSPSPQKLLPPQWSPTEQAHPPSKRQKRTSSAPKIDNSDSSLTDLSSQFHSSSPTAPAQTQKPSPTKNPRDRPSNFPFPLLPSQQLPTTTTTISSQPQKAKPAPKPKADVPTIITKGRHSMTSNSRELKALVESRVLNGVKGTKKQTSPRKTRAMSDRGPNAAQAAKRRHTAGIGK